MQKQEIKQILSKKYDREDWKILAKKIFKDVEYFKEPKKIQTNNEKVLDFIQLGNLNLNDNKTVSLFELKLTKNLNIYKNKIELRNLVTKFIYNITEHFVDLVKSLKIYMQYDKIFANKMNIIQQLTFKETKFITLNLDSYNNIIMPDMYYIKALAIIFNTLKLKENDIRNVKIIVTFDNKINEKALTIFINNISKHLKSINTDNFVSYKEINKFYSQFDKEEFIFYLNMFHFPTICSQNPNSLIPVFLKD